MQISQKKVSPQLNKQIENEFVTVLAELRAADATSFLKDFFTETERTVLVKRLAIALALHRKQSYEQIKKNLKVSSATISSVAEMMKKPGFQVALGKVAEEEWAENVFSKLPKFLRN